MSVIKKNNETQIAEKNFFQKKLYNNQLLKINNKTISLSSNYNLKNKIKKLKTKEINYLDFLKIRTKIKNKNKIFSLSIIKQKNMIKNDIEDISNKFYFNNDLKKYTNNSLTYRVFTQINRSYHPYSFNRVKRSILPHIKSEKKKERQKEINEHEVINLKLLFLNDSRIIYPYAISRNEHSLYRSNTLKEEKPKIIFNKISKIKIPKFLNKNNYDNLEIRDKVDTELFEKLKLYKIIRDSLLNDINQDIKDRNLVLNYLKSMTNNINFHRDIYMVPHIKNNFVLKKPIKDFITINDKLRNKNLLHKQVVLSINSIYIIKKLLEKRKEIENKKMLEEEEYNPKRKIKRDINEDMSENEINLYEQKFKAFELMDFFEKKENYSKTFFAEEKLKNSIY